MFGIVWRMLERKKGGVLFSRSLASSLVTSVGSSHPPLLFTSKAFLIMVAGRPTLCTGSGGWFGVASLPVCASQEVCGCVCSGITHLTVRW